jgi:hypothetical protein
VAQASSTPSADISVEPIPTESQAPAPSSELPSAAPATAVAVPAAPADPCHQHAATYCALNPAVTQATIGNTICVSGWTSTVRPSESYTENLKREQIAAEGLPGGLSAYEEDHRMPLDLGGAPSNATNLSPESHGSSNAKDGDEVSLKDEVCAGQLTLAQAQQQLVATWLGPYPSYRR